MVPPRRDYRFENWSGSASCQPHSYYQPRSEQEIVALVDRAASGGEILRVVGAGHSWNDSACTPHMLVSLDNYDRVLSVDHDKLQVTMQAGRRLKHLVSFLAGQDLAMANLGSVAEQSIAGAISTGTHGTGATFGNLATQVIGMRLVTGTGDVLELSRQEEPELFSAAQVSFGALGVISSVTLQCQPMYQVIERSWSLPFDRALSEMGALVDRYERVKFWWLPHTGRMQVFTYERTAEPAPLRKSFDRKIEESPAMTNLLGTLLWLGRQRADLIPGINRLVGKSYFRKLRRVDRYDRLLNLPMPPRHEETEYAIERDQAPEALRQIRDLVGREGLKVNFIQEVRFVAADDIMLSPAHGRDTCQIGAYMAGGASMQRYFEAFEQIMLELGGRPHWGKAFATPSDRLARLYPQFARFDELRRQLDPQGIFANEYVRRIFR